MLVSRNLLSYFCSQLLFRKNVDINIRDGVAHTLVHKISDIRIFRTKKETKQHYLNVQMNYTINSD